MVELLRLSEAHLGQAPAAVHRRGTVYSQLKTEPIDFAPRAASKTNLCVLAPARVGLSLQPDAASHQLRLARQHAEQYTAIAGANIDPGHNPPRIRTPEVSYGVVAFNGVMFINAMIRSKDITDGTSHVLLLGEQTDWAFDASGVQNTCRASGVAQSHWQGDWWTGQTISHGNDHC